MRQRPDESNAHSGYHDTALLDVFFSVITAKEQLPKKFYKYQNFP